MLERLEQSETRDRQILDTIQDGYYELDPQGIILATNRALCQMLGYSRDDLLELTFQDITHPDDLDSDLQQVERLLAGDIARYSLEKRYRRRDGSLLWANLSATLVRHTNGAPHYFISVVEDIGLRKQQELALQQAATVFESTQEAVVIVDANRRILTSNPAFTGITAFSNFPLRVWSGVGSLIALIALGMLPTSQWSVLMRVDMLCMALTFGGLLCGMLALTRPRAVYLAALLFVAAVYTKQTAIAAPAAVFGTLLFLRPRTALTGIGCAVALGLVMQTAASLIAATVFSRRAGRAAGT